MYNLAKGLAGYFMPTDSQLFHPDTYSIVGSFLACSTTWTIVSIFMMNVFATTSEPNRVNVGHAAKRLFFKFTFSS